MAFCDGAKALYQSTPVAPGERSQVVRAFGVSLLDMSWTLASMLALDPARTHVTGLTLWRPMYERWLRMGYFVACADDVEVSAFLNDGTVPKSRSRRRRSGEALEISPREIAQLLGQEMLPLKERFDSLAVEYNPIWSDLVHGGVNLVRLYDDHGGYGSKAAPGVVIELIYRTTFVTTLTTSYVAMQVSYEENARNAEAFARLDAEVTSILQDSNALAIDPRALIQVI
jgi:hypothetical protein